MATILEGEFHEIPRPPGTPVPPDDNPRRKWYQRWWVGLLLIPIPIVTWLGIYLFFKYLPISRDAKVGIAVILILFAIVGVSGRWNEWQAGEQPTTTTSAQGQQSQGGYVAESEPTPPSTYGWLMYSSPQQLFSVQVPPGWLAEPGFRGMEVVSHDDGVLNEPGEVRLVWMHNEVPPWLTMADLTQGTIGRSQYPGLMYVDPTGEVFFYYQAAGYTWSIHASTGGLWTDDDWTTVLLILSTVSHGF